WLHLQSALACRWPAGDFHRFRIRWNSSILFRLEFRRRVHWHRGYCKSHLRDRGDFYGYSHDERQRVTTAINEFSTISDCCKSTSACSNRQFHLHSFKPQRWTDSLLRRFRVWWNTTLQLLLYVRLRWNRCWKIRHSFVSSCWKLQCCP